MNFETRGSLLRTLKFDPEKKLGKKLTEKPILQDPEIGIHLASTGSNYSVAEEDLVLPKLICGLEQGNRPSVIKETNITRCKRLGQVASSLLASRVCLEKVQFECNYGVLIRFLTGISVVVRLKVEYDACKFS
jgi:hypothetical protein